MFGFADLSIDGKYDNISCNNRLYPTDMIFLRYFLLTNPSADITAIKGKLAETYVYNILRKHIIGNGINPTSIITSDTNGETDFCSRGVKNISSKIGFEIKWSKGSTKTVTLDNNFKKQSFPLYAFEDVLHQLQNTCFKNEKTSLF